MVFISSWFVSLSLFTPHSQSQMNPYWLWYFEFYSTIAKSLLQVPSDISCSQNVNGPEVSYNLWFIHCFFFFLFFSLITIRRAVLYCSSATLSLSSCWGSCARWFQFCSCIFVAWSTLFCSYSDVTCMIMMISPLLKMCF